MCQQRLNKAPKAAREYLCRPYDHQEIALQQTGHPGLDSHSELHLQGYHANEAGVGPKKVFMLKSRRQEQSCCAVPILS